MADAKEKEQRAWIWSIIRPLAPMYREVIIASLFINVLALAVPVFTMQVYDRVIFTAGLTTLQGLGLGMIVALAFDFFLRQTRSRIMQRAALRIDVNVGQKVYNKVMSLPLPELEGKQAAFWNALFRDVDTVRNTLSGPTALLLVDLPFALLFLGLIVVIAAPRRTVPRPRAPPPSEGGPRIPRAKATQRKLPRHDMTRTALEGFGTGAAQDTAKERGACDPACALDPTLPACRPVQRPWPELDGAPAIWWRVARSLPVLVGSTLAVPHTTCR